MEAGAELTKPRKVANTWMGVFLLNYGHVFFTAHCFIHFQGKGLISCLMSLFLIQKSVIIRMQFANKCLDESTSNQLLTTIFFTAHCFTCLMGHIKSHQLFKVLFLLQNIFIYLFLNFNLIQGSLVFHVVQFSDKRYTFKSR